MKEINVTEIENAVRDLCVRANLKLPCSLERLIRSSPEAEVSPVGKEVLRELSSNLDAAERESLPICQDTGMAVVFLEIGQEVHVNGGSLTEAINRGVAKGYKEGYLRCSIVSDPLNRINTGDNTPAIIHIVITEGDKLSVSVCPKGFGSENKSRIKMFNPSASPDEIEDFIVETAAQAGSSACPPMVIGIGIGGDFEYCAYLSKKALCRDIGVSNPNPFYAGMEKSVLNKINALGIGPQGFGGSVTALSAAVEYFPTHIAGLPVAVNIGCHVTRHASVEL